MKLTPYYQDDLVTLYHATAWSTWTCSARPT